MNTRKYLRLIAVVIFSLLLAPGLWAQQNNSDVILQGFYWNTVPGDLNSGEGVWWDTIAVVAPQLGAAGFSTVWTPPANKGFAGKFDMGYGIYDYYDFGEFDQKFTVRTRHGNKAQLLHMIDALHDQGIKVMADVVLNHRAGAEEEQPEDCDLNPFDDIEVTRFTKFRPASGRLPMDAEDFHPNGHHCDLNPPYHDRIFFEDLCYFNDINQVLNPDLPNDGWYFGPHDLGAAGDSLINWGRYLLDEIGFDELRLDAVRHIEPGFLAPFMVELADGEQPFVVGEYFDGNLDLLAGYHGEVEGFVSNFGAGSKNANFALFDFNLRFALRDMANNTSGGYNMQSLNGAGLHFGKGLDGEDIVTFVENHDVDRIGWVEVSCGSPEAVLQVGNTCLGFSQDSGHDPVVFDKHLAYAYIMAAKGRPSVFWKDWFWFGLDREIEWQMALRAATAGGGAAPISSLGPDYQNGTSDQDLFVMNRNGDSEKGGLILAMNDNPAAEASAWVNTPFSDMELKDYSDAYLFTQTRAFGDSRTFIRAFPRNYAWYAPTGLYPQPPGEPGSSFTLGNHQGAKLHFVVLRAEDAANLLVNGAPIQPGDEVAILPAGSDDAVGLGRIGQSFRWDGEHDMIIEVLGGGNAAEAKGGLLDGDGWRLAVYDQSTGTTEIVDVLNFAPNGTPFTFDPDRPASRGGSFPMTATHGSPTYQVGGVTLITSFDTRPILCDASSAAASAYDDGWQSGDNDGSGFGAWNLASFGDAGHFVGSSANNGDGDSNGDGDINAGNRAWGMFANNGGLSEAIRPFDELPGPGSTFSLLMDNGWIDGGTVGFGLQNGSGQNLLEFFFAGGQANYTLLDGSGAVDTGLGFTDEGLDFRLTLLDANTYEVTITRLEGGTATFTGNLIAQPGGQDIAQVRFFNFNAGPDSPRDAYFNNLEICALPVCPIASVTAGAQNACDPIDNTYDQNIVVTFNSIPADGQLSVNGVTVPLNIVDNQQTVTLTDLVSDGQPVDVTVVVTGNSGCTVEMPALFSAQADCQPPVIECPGNIVTSTDPDLCTAVVTYETPAGTDNLPGATTALTAGLASGSAFPNALTTVTYTVTDAAGKQSSCSFNVVVVDEQLPTITCPDGITAFTDADACSAEVMFNPPVATDNCTISSVTRTSGLSSGSAFPKGDNMVEFKATDATGNSAVCTFTITVIDNKPPVVDCPENIVTDNDENACGALVDFAAPTAMDNCPGVTISQTSGPASGSFFAVGITTLNFLVSDAAGNEVPCSFTVTVNDTQDPVITCPSSITRDNDEDLCGASVTYTVPVGTDNCPGAATSRTAGLGSGAFFPVGTTTETYTVVDAAGRSSDCSFTVTVVDAQDPVIVCPRDITVDNTEGQCGAIVNFIVTATDNCPGVQLFLTGGTQASGSFFPVGVTNQSFIARDAALNTDDCSFTVTVNDAEPPVMTNCPGNITVGNDQGLCTAVVSYPAPAATDNCGSPTVAQTAGLGSGAAFPVGTTPEVYTFTDGARNAVECRFLVTVEDREVPVIQLTGNTITLWPPNGRYETIDLADCISGVTDNCDELSIADIVISSVSSDEPDDIPGDADGETIDDIVIAPDCQSVQLRSERNEELNGRVYTIHFSVMDAAGNEGTASCIVKVPANQGVNGPAVDDGPAYTVTPSCGAGAPSMMAAPAGAEVVEGGILNVFPNPFRSSATIRFYLPEAERINLEVYDLSGRRVTQVFSGVADPGWQDRQWAGTDESGRILPAGTYLVRLQTEKEIMVKKITLIR